VQLMLAVQRDDDVAAFESLFRKYVHQVAGFARSMVGSNARAEELAQEAFVQVYRTRGRYEPRARFATWLYRIVTNLCVSEVRRAEHRLNVATRRGGAEDPAPDPGELADLEGRSGEDDLLAQERVDAIRRALTGLPAQQRAAVWLARVEGFSYEEVGHALGCSVSAVKSLIHRATVTLRDQMAAYD
jgi:RNA polymerase sigma-70 factor (ECF subfamily)